MLDIGPSKRLPTSTTTPEKQSIEFIICFRCLTPQFQRRFLKNTERDGHPWKTFHAPPIGHTGHPLNPTSKPTRFPRRRHGPSRPLFQRKSSSCETLLTPPSPPCTLVLTCRRLLRPLGRVMVALPCRHTQCSPGCTHTNRWIEAGTTLPAGSTQPIVGPLVGTGSGRWGGVFPPASTPLLAGRTP